jgi:hypothetical protein
MRLSYESIVEITHLTRKSAQVAWFRQHLGVDVPHDRFGPILTDTAYEKLLEKRLGLGTSLATNEKPRPTVNRPQHLNTA